MGSAGAEAGDGVRQAGGLPGRDSRQVNSSSCYLRASARRKALKSPAVGKGKGFMDYTKNTVTEGDACGFWLFG